MPTYLCHGFRWQRRSIRVYVVVQNLDDAAPEWIIKRGSARNLIESFYNLFDFLPECTFPPTRSSSRTPGSRSVSHSVSQNSMTQPAHKDDDDDASFQTTRSAWSRGRSRSRSRSRSTATLHQQPSHTMGQNTPTTTTTTTRRPSSNSSRKRSEAAGSSNGPGLSSRAALTYQHNQPPPSPPPSQPGFNPAFQAGDHPDDPVLAQNWSPVKLVEEHDPANLEEVSRPYAYVADYVTRINDSCSIVEEIQRYESRVRHDPLPPVTGASSDEMLNGKRDTSKLGRRAGWLERLRDQLQHGEDIRWYVVVNGDEERAWAMEEAPQGGGSRSSAVHHKQYTHQQLIFEGQDRLLEVRRQQLRQELGYEHGGVDRLLERRPKLPQTDLPPLRTQTSTASMSQNMPTSPKTPKTPGRGTFRRLFSRGKVDSGTAT